MIGAMKNDSFTKIMDELNNSTLCDRSPDNVSAVSRRRMSFTELCDSVDTYWNALLVQSLIELNHDEGDNASATLTVDIRTNYRNADTSEFSPRIRLETLRNTEQTGDHSHGREANTHAQETRKTEGQKSTERHRQKSAVR